MVISAHIGYRDQAFKINPHKSYDLGLYFVLARTGLYYCLMCACLCVCLLELEREQCIIGLLSAPAIKLDTLLKLSPDQALNIQN